MQVSMVGNITRASFIRLGRSRGVFFQSLTSLPENHNKEGSQNEVGATSWRKAQLQKLEEKFKNENINAIDKEEDLQPEWKNMERRVLSRKSLTKEEVGGKTGRRNIRPTDEESWLGAGLYEGEDDGTTTEEGKE